MEFWFCFRLKFFSERATNYIRKLFYDVVERRKGTGQSSESDLVNQLLKLKDNLKLPAEPDSRKISNNVFSKTLGKAKYLQIYFVFSLELADDLMLAQAALFIFAAIGTSSTTICYCLHELAHDLEKQVNEHHLLNYFFLCKRHFCTYCESHYALIVSL